MPHLNDKQNKNTNPIISRQDYHLTQPCPSEEKQTKQTNKQTNKKNIPSTNLILYEAYTKHCTNFRRGETKKKKDFNPESQEKETSNTISLNNNNNNEKAEKYCTNEGTN